MLTSVKNPFRDKLIGSKTALQPVPRPVTMPPTSPASRPASLFIYGSLLANVVLFFWRPLFSTHYIFPWDFRGVQLPLITFLADELKQGRFALWNPFNYCGYPVFANIEACYFHPLVLLSAFLSAHTSLSLPKLLEWTVVLQLWGAGVAAYHCLREFRASRPAAWVGAIIFQTSGYFASQTEHMGATMAVAWMPLAWLAILKLRDRFRPGWLATLGFALGMAILGGLPQATLAVFVSTVVLAIVLAAIRAARAKVIASALVGSALGVGLAAVQFIPTHQLTQWSVAQYRAGWLGAGGGLHWQSLVSLVLPNHYHQFDMAHFNGPADVTFLYLYCSIGGLLLAIFAVVRFQAAMVPLAAMTGFGLVWMLGEHEPLWNLVYPLLPVSIRIGIHPEFSYCIFGFGLAGLAAMGLDRLPVRENWRYLAGPLIAADLFLVGSGRPMNLGSLDAEPGVTRDAFQGSAPLLREVQQYVNRQNPPWRLDNTADTSMDWVNQAPISQLATANGASPLALEEVIHLRLLQQDGFPWGWYYPVGRFDAPVLDVMNVKYLIAGAKEAPRVRQTARFQHVASLPQGYELFENLTVMRRFFLVHDAVAGLSPEETRRLIETAAVDLHRTAITEPPIHLPPGGSSEKDAIGAIDFGPASLSLKVTAAAPSLLVLAESYYPGWLAWVDDRPVPVYRADIAFRGVAVPAGTHTVRMQFRPPILPLSLAISGMTALLLCALGFRRLMS